MKGGESVKISKIVETLGGEMICGAEYLDRDVNMACGCDLMSDVLSFIKSDYTLLLTGLTKPQVIYTADAVNIKTICFVRGKRPDEEVIELATEREIALLFTKLPLFESCGRLYKLGLIGCSEYEE
jgi:hypothetical protein